MHKFDLTSAEFKRNPFPTWEQMRALGPVIPARLPLIGKVWLFTTYQAASEMLRDSKTYARDPNRAGKKYLSSFLRFVPRHLRVVANNMMSVDGEEHRRLRGIVDRAFAKRTIQQMRPQLHVLANRICDDLESDQQSGATVNLAQAFARRYPLSVISELLGLPDTDRQNFEDWGNRLTHVKSFWSFTKVVPGLIRMRRYLIEQIESCRSEPREGLLTDLIHTEFEGHQLNDDELLAMAFLLLVAGHETTVHLLTTSLATLFQHPDQLEKLRANWSLSTSAVEEVMRYVSPAEITKPRMLTRDLEVSGQHLKRGDYAIAMIGAANHDPRQFPNPDVFDIERHPNPHLGFGTGIHVCLGLKLARAEAEIALQTLFERFPQLRSAVDPQQIAWAERLGMRSIPVLPVHLR